ncbi:MAG: hypothetical protein ORN49_02095 [Rhodobacteraceae bacterium]|nr:hypothetical protein [Paracoccaceae bacterium]
MATDLHGLQSVGVPTMVARAPQPARDGGIAALAGGANTRHDPHPDLPSHSRSGRQGADPQRITPPPPPDPPTGPPPAFEANVLEVQARALREPWRLAAKVAQADRIARDPPAKTAWHAPEAPDPALIDRQL